MTTFSNETCLNVKHQRFVFQHVVQIYLNAYWQFDTRHSDSMRDFTTDTSLYQSSKQLIGQILTKLTAVIHN